MSQIHVRFFGGPWDGFSKMVEPTDTVNFIKPVTDIMILGGIQVGHDPDNAKVVGVHDTYHIYQLAPDFFLGLYSKYSLVQALITLWDDHCETTGTAHNIRSKSI